MELWGCGGGETNRNNLNNTETVTTNTLNKIDVNAPTVTLIGLSSMTVLKGEKYEEAGAIAVDKEEGIVDVNITGMVDTSKVGHCQVYYEAKDSANNITIKTRDISVVLETNLAKDGKALMPISVAIDASEELLKSANELASKLNEIIGVDKTSSDGFIVKRGSFDSGIVLATPEDRDDLDDKFESNNLEKSEAYYLKTDKQGLYIVGATPKAVEFAIADLLYTIGYRHYFPGKTWEIIPLKPILTVGIYKRESPAFFAKNIWYNTGTWNKNRLDSDEKNQSSNDEMFELWKHHNRMDSENKMNYGHTYQLIYGYNKERFFEKDGIEKQRLFSNPNDNREFVKFCVKEPEIQQIVIDYAKAYFTQYPNRNSISLEPSDNGGWYDFNEKDESGNPLVDNCNDYADGELKTVSDRVVFLANVVAKALKNDKKTKDKIVTLYAYYNHISTPNITVDSHIHVKIQQGFNFSNFTLEELLIEWKRKTAQNIAIGDYLSVKDWNFDIPGQAKASKLNTVGIELYNFYNKGIRMYGAESGETWGHTGLGYYLVSRILWEADKIVDINGYIEDVKEDFYKKAFENAYEPMKTFYELIDGDNCPRVTDDLIGRMYRLLNKASENTMSSKVQARIELLILYTRFVELSYLLKQINEKNLYTWKPTFTIRRIGTEEGIENFELVKEEEQCIDTKKESSLLEIDECTSQHQYSFTNQLTDDFEENLAYLNKVDRKFIEQIEVFIKFMYRAKNSMMFHSYAWYDQLIKSPVHYFIPQEVALFSSEADDPWKLSTPFNQKEINTMVENGMTKYQLNTFKRKKFSEILVPSISLNLGSKLPITEQLKIKEIQMASSTLLNHSIRDRSNAIAYTYIEDGKSSLTLKIKNYKRHDIKITALDDERKKNEGLMKQLGINSQITKITIDNLKNGLYKLDLIGEDIIRLYSAFELTFKTQVNEPSTHWFGTLPSFYFYVPKGTTNIGLYTNATAEYPLEIFDANMQKIKEITRSQYVNIQVPSNQDGRLWKYQGGALGVELLTVPPYISYSDNILLPQEVVEADSN